MSDHFKRTDRISQMIQRKLSQIIYQEIKDPRLPKLITISAVKCSNDLSHAQVYFTVYNADQAATEIRLNAAASYLRTALARSLSFRIVPQLHFRFDPSVEYGTSLSRLIDKVNREDDAASSSSE